ncbi:MAG: alanine racemase [Clostridia bacterium]|nr:alanine racemase [Clostridia bacterium]
MKVKINLKAIERNLNALRLAFGKPLIFMCKADAYGHGLARVVRSVSAEGYGVATEEEGVVVRSLTNAPVYVTAPRKENVALLRGFDLIALVGEPTLAAALVEAGVKRCHIKVNSGMNRLGFSSPEESAAAADKLISGGVRVEGVCTHYKSTDEGDRRKQNAVFEKCVSAVREKALSLGLFSPIFTHVTGGGSVETADACRVGLACYGYGDGLNVPLEKAMRVESEILAVKEIRRGQTLGYNAFRARENLVACTVLGGYADGIDRSEKGRCVLVGGAKARIAAVCMDSFEIVTHRLDLKAGRRVIIMSDAIDANYIAKSRGTIPYEVLVGYDRPRAEYLYDG